MMSKLFGGGEMEDDRECDSDNHGEQCTYHRGDLWESDGVEARDSNVSLERRGASASDMVRKRM